MITVTEAKKIIADTIQPLPKEIISLMLASGHILAEDVFAQTDVPGFNQSAMDGYAIRWEDRQESLPVNGEVPAGDEGAARLQSHQAIRIFTGAPVPEGADTVVMQEKVILQNNHITITDEELLTGKNIRVKGSEIRKGAGALSKGSHLSPAALGFLASVGIQEVAVIPSPKIAVIITGSELVKAGASLKKGQVFESNSYALRAGLQRAGVTDIYMEYAEDDLDILVSVLTKALSQADMVILTGGVSVGDYDFVLKATETCRITPLFHKVKQKPGKPLFFGAAQHTPVFGLPGNPSSVLTCFYEYVLPAIQSLTGKKELLPQEKARLANAWKKPAGLTHFLKGSLQHDGVHILDAQESYRMSSFARANCLVLLPEQETNFEKGDIVEIHRIL